MIDNNKKKIVHFNLPLLLLAKRVDDNLSHVIKIKRAVIERQQVKDVCVFFILAVG